MMLPPPLAALLDGAPRRTTLPQVLATLPVILATLALLPALAVLPFRPDGERRVAALLRRLQDWTVSLRGGEDGGGAGAGCGGVGGRPSGGRGAGTSAGVAGCAPAGAPAVPQ